MRLHISGLLIYQVSGHRGIRDVPALRWKKGIALWPPALPVNSEFLDVALGYTEERVVSNRGIELDNLFYNDEELAMVRRILEPHKKIIIKRNPTGGKPGVDTCTGNSNGAHLHFQIDKNDGNTDPYFPSSTALNQRDTDFQVTAKTYNPIVFVTGGYRWSFNKSGDRELWELFNIQRWGVSNDALWVDGIGDTYIRRGGDVNCGQTKPCSSSFAAEASMYPKVYLDLYNVCFSNPGKLYFTTSSSPNWDETKSVAYFPTGQGPYQQHIFMTQNSEWKNIITGLRIDPGVNCSSGDDPTYYGKITVER